MAEQTIKCQIESCIYNAPDHYCKRKSIVVTPCGRNDCDSVSEKSESMCADFEEKKRGWF